MTTITKTFSEKYPKGCDSDQAKAAYDLVKGKKFQADVELFEELAEQPEERILKLTEKYGAGKAAHALTASLVIDFQAIIKRTAEAKGGNISKEELTDVCEKWDFSAPVKRGGGKASKPLTQEGVNNWMTQQMAKMTPEEAQAFIKAQADQMRAQLQAKLQQK